MVSQLLPIEEAEHDEWLEKLTENIQKQSLVSPVLEKQHIELAIQVTIFVYLQDDIILLHVEVFLFCYTFAGLH